MTCQWPDRQTYSIHTTYHKNTSRLELISILLFFEVMKLQMISANLQLPLPDIHKSIV